MHADPVDRELAHIARTLPPGQLHTFFPELTAARARHWEDKLDRLRSACGCREGAVGALSLMAIMLGVMFSLSAAAVSPWWAKGLALAAALLVGTATGKHVARRRSEARLFEAFTVIRAEASAGRASAE